MHLDELAIGFIILGSSPTWATPISLFHAEFQSLTRFTKGLVAALGYHLSNTQK
jgi:hypothetical protein